MKQIALIPFIYFLVILSTSGSTLSSSPSTFWNDYPACERQCHQDIYANQSCTLQNSCGCSQGCLCLDDNYLCATPSWLIAVSQCIGKECGPSAVTEAASIASNGCGSYGLTLVVSPQSLIQDGLGAVPSSSSNIPSSSRAVPSSSSTVPPSPISNRSSSSHSLSGPAIGGIIASIIVVLFGILAGLWWLGFVPGTDAWYRRLSDRGGRTVDSSAVYELPSQQKSTIHELPSQQKSTAHELFSQKESTVHELPIQQESTVHELPSPRDGRRV